MSLCRFQRQYEQLSQFERRRIIGMMEAVKSARQVARSLGRSEYVVVLRDETRFYLSSDDNRVRVGRPSAERLDPAFALRRQSAPTAGVMIWGVIAYNTRAPLVFIHLKMAVQWYVHEFLYPHVLPLMQLLPGAIFQQDNAWPHTTKESQVCLCTVTTFTLPARSTDLSPIEHIWDPLERQVWHPTSLN
ncbi:transposable element Tcb2 transposase [Trichonephila clavipes]|nr:transposable element Tcb2 transposase [Trichonephila clavipes]